MATVDLFSFINTKTTAAESKASAQKTFMDKGVDKNFDFTKVFDKVSKTYDQSKTETKSYNDRIAAHSEKKAEKQSDNVNELKTNKKQPDKAKSDEKIDHVEDKVQSKTEDHADKSSSLDSKEKDSAPEKETNSSAQESASQQPAEQDVKPVQQDTQNMTANSVVDTNEILIPTVTSEDLSTIQKSEQEISSPAQQVATIKNEVDPNKSNIKVQPQTQQALLNMNVQKEELPKEAVLKKPETPQVKVNQEVIANIGAKTDKTDGKSLLDQTNLTQEILDKTDAQVISVETTTSDNSGLLNHQNAQEQGVKIALEGLQSQGASSSSATQQTAFDKNLNSVNTGKEISKSEILSQIHTKLDSMKEETTTKVTIVLKPESLGKINLELINGKDGLTARMTTENAQVKELLDKSLDELKNTLGTQGVNVNNVSVRVSQSQESAAQDNLNFDQNQFQNQNHQSQSGNSGNFSQDEFGNAFDETTAQSYFAEGSAEQEELPIEALLSGSKVDYKI